MHWSIIGYSKKFLIWFDMVQIKILSCKASKRKLFYSSNFFIFYSNFGAEISPQSFLRYWKLDHFTSKLTKITIFKKIQTLIVNLQSTNFGFEGAKRSVMNGAMNLFYSFDQNNQFREMAGRWKSGHFSVMKYLWIHNIDAICNMLAD